MREQKYKVKGRSGEELCVYLPAGKIDEVDKARGQYFTRSKFVLWALDRAIEEVSSGIMRLEKETPLGATVRSQAPNSLDSSSNTTLTTPSKEDQQLSIEGGLAGVS
jgi:hypothetical protein